MSQAPQGKMIQVTQGAFHVSADPGMVFSAILGSCIATCLYDPLASIGGMNHFLLPGTGEAEDHTRRYGKDLTLSMIEALERMGAERARLQAKLFGGGQIIPGMVRIGTLNADFAERFLSAERIPVVTRSVGGDRARRIRFWPCSGKAQQLLLEPIAPEIAQIL
jgi:chemotaxis protein CheD